MGYLCFWPVPADPRSWSAPTPPGYVGAHLANTRLAGLRTIDIGKEFGPEHIAIGPDGKLYAAMTSGSLLRMDPDGGGQEVFANRRASPRLRKAPFGGDTDPSGFTQASIATIRLWKAR